MGDVTRFHSLENKSKEKILTRPQKCEMTSGGCALCKSHYVGGSLVVTPCPFWAGGFPGKLHVCGGKLWWYLSGNIPLWHHRWHRPGTPSLQALYSQSVRGFVFLFLHRREGGRRNSVIAGSWKSLDVIMMLQYDSDPLSQWPLCDATKGIQTFNQVTTHLFYQES